MDAAVSCALAWLAESGQNKAGTIEKKREAEGAASGSREEGGSSAGHFYGSKVSCFFIFSPESFCKYRKVTLA